MRLLQLGENGEVILTKDIPGNTPPYAVLSHRWQAEGEVVLEDIRSGTAIAKSGYEKVLSCGRQAQRDGLKYFWIDACCINPRNKAELSVAINSFFRIFSQAEKCYVHLSDVGDRNSEDWQHQFYHSTWFTRAWTIQELIAPKSLDFFSGTWSFLGDRVTLALKIQDITGIPIRALLGDPLSSFSVDERMAWAANRMAVQEEDMVYSLMGLFDVLMPVDYGEGEANAMRRLQAAIQESVSERMKTNITQMRLLIADPGPLRMETVPANSSVQYAILSHTWGTDEVSFDDMCTGRAKTRRAYSKLKSCSTLAASQGFDYLWVDTCCIDKSSSAELQEAICSMYSWYQNAKVCYVYLEDYKKDGLDPLDTCKWFTRGWTLQEMIAPAFVEFYDQNWREIGTKQSLCGRLAEITSVDPVVLRGEDPLKRTVAERMSWAASRSTTRIEDQAYCLMGLFNVFMPMLYGEGHRAFQRLQEEILKQTEDDTIFSWTANLANAFDRGIFAHSPAEFSVVRRERIVSRGTHAEYKAHRKAPPVLTSRGLVLTLPILRDGSDDNTILAWVSCSSADTSDRSSPLLCIRLREIQASPQVFVRAFPHHLDSPAVADLRNFEETTICVVPSIVDQYIDVKDPYSGEIIVQPLTDKKGHKILPDPIGIGRTARWSAENGSSLIYWDQRGTQQLASFLYEGVGECIVAIGSTDGLPWCSIHHLEELEAQQRINDELVIAKDAVMRSSDRTDRAERMLWSGVKVTATTKVLRSTEAHLRRFSLQVEMEHAGDTQSRGNSTSQLTNTRQGLERPKPDPTERSIQSQRKGLFSTLASRLKSEHSTV